MIVDSSPDMDSYEVISGKSNPSSPSIEDLGVVRGDFYDKMSPENDLSRDSDQGVTTYDPNLNFDDEQERDCNKVEGGRHDCGAEEEEEHAVEDQGEYDERSEYADEDSEEEDNVEVTLKDSPENFDDKQHPDLRKRLAKDQNEN